MFFVRGSEIWATHFLIYGGIEMKKFYGWLLCVILLLNTLPTAVVVADNNNVWDGSIASSYAGGSGTEKDPYLISNGAQLAYVLSRGYFNNCYNTYYAITNDITLNTEDVFTKNEDGVINGIKPDSQPNVWIPKDFYGYLDGNNHTIYGLYCDGKSNCSSLFDSIGRTVKNLTLGYGYVLGGDAAGFADRVNDGSAFINCKNYCTISGFGNLGGFALTNTGTIDSCVNYGSIFPSIENNGVCAGGICRLNYEGGVIINCENNGDITGASGLGGIAEYNYGLIARCINNGHISGASSCGGITGIHTDGFESFGIITSCINNGHIKDAYNLGGIAGASHSYIENCFNTGTIEASTKGYCGGLVGQMYDNTTLINCVTTGSYIGEVSDLCGSTWSSATISNCYYDISIAENSKYGVGKTVQELNSQSFIDELNNFVESSSVDYVQYWVVGDKLPRFAQKEDLLIVTSSANEGGSIFPLGEKEVLSGYGIQYTITPNYGYKIGTITIDGIPVEVSASYKLENVSKNSKVVVNFVENGLIAPTYSGGTGTKDDPYQISNVKELRRFAQQVGFGNEEEYYYTITDDIVLNTPDKFLYDENEKVIGPNPDNMPEEWPIIGNWSNGNLFIGNVDGQNHSISGLYINKPNEYAIGFIGQVYDSMSGPENYVKNLKLTYGYITGKNDVGSIAGSGRDIFDCHNDNVTIVSEGSDVGGITGSLYGAFESAKISNCTNSANVTGYSGVGGIVGTGGDIESCLNYGNVATTYMHVGGIAGTGYNIYDCKNYGSVSAPDRYSPCVGGIAGVGEILCNSFNFGSVLGNGASGLIGNVRNGQFINSVNYGKVTGSGSAGWCASGTGTVINCLSAGQVVGGVADSNSMNNVRNSYNMSQKTNATSNYAVDISEQKYNTEEMVIKLNKEVQLLNNDKLKFWQLSEDTFVPVLTDRKDFYTVKVSSLAGGSISPFRNFIVLKGSDFTLELLPDDGNVIYKVIKNGQEIPAKNTISVTDINQDIEIEVLFSDSSGNIVSGFDSGAGTKEDPFIIKNATQLTNLAYRVNNEYTNYKGYWIALADNIDMSQISFESIGKDANHTFEGFFDGKGYKISNICFETTNERQGLFGTVGENANISNLTLENVSVTTKYDNVGIIAGVNLGLISKCKIIGESSVASNAFSNIGGIVGYNYGDINECDNASNISGAELSGGIAGYNVGNIVSCINNGKITDADTAGGIVGGNEGKVLQCENNGMITTTAWYCSVGGITGFLNGENALIKKCTNNAEISATGGMGGIVGEIYDGYVEECTNYANVSSTTGEGGYIGGIFGDCSSWSHNSWVKKCLNYGNVTSTGWKGEVGGISGLSTIKIDSCFNYGTVSGDNNVGGICGDANETIANCGNYGDILGESENIGGVAGNSETSILNSYNRGAVTGGENVGGIAGYNYNRKGYYRENQGVFNCYNSGVVSGDNSAACVGYNAYDGIINSTYALETCSDKLVAVNDNDSIASFVKKDELLKLLNDTVSTYVPIGDEILTEWVLDSEGLPKLEIPIAPVLEVASWSKTNSGYDFSVTLSPDKINEFNKGTLIVSIYNGDKFIGMGHCPVSNTDTSKTLSVVTNEIGTYGKIMLWSDFNNLIPICNATDFEIR